jgi:excisionase family DNA binding protein
MNCETLLISHAEAAEILDVSDRTFYRLVRKGFVRKHRLPGMIYGKYYREDVLKFKAAALAESREPEKAARSFLDAFEQQQKIKGAKR